MRHSAARAGIEVEGFCTHALRATAATNVLDHEAELAKIQEWLGHASIATERLYGNPPRSKGRQPWSYAARASFIAGVMPPSAMFGRSLL